MLFSKACLFCAKSVSIAQTFLNCYPKQPFSALRRPFAPSHNLLSTKERRCSFDVRSNSLRCNAGASHRFKSSPSIPGKLAVSGVAGYMMNAGHFRRNLVSSGDLNRPRESRGSQPSACFCGTFCTPQKVPTRTPLPEAPRFSKPRISPPKQQLRTNKIKSFPILFVRHKKYDKKAFASFGAARSACIPPPSAASQKRKDPFCL